MRSSESLNVAFHFLKYLLKLLQALHVQGIQHCISHKALYVHAAVLKLICPPRPVAGLLNTSVLAVETKTKGPQQVNCTESGYVQSLQQSCMLVCSVLMCCVAVQFEGMLQHA